MHLPQRWLAIALMAAAAVAEASGQQTTPAFRIVVVEGEDAINIIQQKTAVRPLIEVRDANNLPVAGVPVTFSVAGPGASFAGGVQSITVVTNAAGQAAAAGLTPTAVGAVQIQATAAIQGQTAIATITQTNVLTAAQAAAAASAAAAGAGAAGAGVSTGVVAGIIGGGAAAVGGTVVATRGRTGSDTGARPTSTRPPATTVVDDRPPTPTTPPTTDPRPPTTTPDPRPTEPTPTPAPRPDESPCTFTVDPRLIRAGSGGGTERVTVAYTPRDCANRRWIVTNVPAFVDASPHEGDGDGVVTLRIAAHTGAFERTDAISIAGNVISIVQPPRPAAASACMPEWRRGGDLGELRTFELGAVEGTVSFTFNPGPRNDSRIIVSHEGRPLIDTGCGVPPNARTVWLTYAGRSSSITVQVMPNCAGSQGSTWEYQLSCPLQR